MALDTKMSCLAAVLTFIISISTLHLIKPLIVDMPLFYILIGIYGGILCVVLLTAINNLENLIFSNDFCAQLFPEVFLSIVVSSFSVGSIHRICGTFFDIMCMLLLLESNISTNLLISQYSADHCCGKEKAELITIPQMQMFFSMDTLSYVS
ncbi:hypothetical protein EGR_06937 [Echinococcus granulosus]|uniref:Uncharacterized protein n=1 Tax=Echinococcus granulosus TaxID=6210 RepID=W6U9X9_ECHGR|nr:hypothetical protein EGR_06937 [Echinococcus granulosus]EUB58193.1 hypothetical protein EGR_06937 [Echinococcus granulosus]